MSDQNAIELLDFCRNFDRAMLVTHSQVGMIAIPMMIAEVDSLGNFLVCDRCHIGKSRGHQQQP